VEFSLRDYRLEDFEALWAIDQKCFAPGIAYSRRELSIYIRRRGSFTILAGCAEGKTIGTSQIVGFIVAEANSRGVGHIISIDVVPEARRSGVGSKLLIAAEQRLRSNGCRLSVLETAVDNTSALSFYKRHGYQVVRAEPRYYSNGTDALVLEKQLLAHAKNVIGAWSADETL
jgi:ribosomal protein S18 acetylase RimI-like enzyme